MAKRVNIRWRNGAFRELRTLPEVRKVLGQRAERIAEAAGIGYQARATEVTRGGRGRARTAVLAATANAQRDNARNHTLMSALSAGRQDV